MTSWFSCLFGHSYGQVYDLSKKSPTGNYDSTAFVGYLHFEPGCEYIQYGKKKCTKCDHVIEVQQLSIDSHNEKPGPWLKSDGSK